MRTAPTRGALSYAVERYGVSGGADPDKTALSLTIRERATASVIRQSRPCTDVAGTTHIASTRSYSSSWNFSIGSSVPVRFDPANPTDVRPKTGLLSEWTLQIIFGALGVFAILMSIFLRIVFRRARPEDLVFERPEHPLIH